MGENESIKKCKWCGRTILEVALKCERCGSKQNPILYYATSFGVFIPIVGLLIACGQFYIGASQTKKAENYAVQSQLAYDQSKITTDKVEILASSVIKTTEIAVETKKQVGEALKSIGVSKEQILKTQVNLLENTIQTNLKLIENNNKNISSNDNYIRSYKTGILGVSEAHDINTLTTIQRQPIDLKIESIQTFKKENQKFLSENQKLNQKIETLREN